MSLSDFLNEEQKVLDKAKELFAEEIQAFDMIRLVVAEVAKSINTTKTADIEPPYIFLTLFHIIHCNLRTAFVLTLRGHYIEALAVLRPATELTSHLYNMSLSPRPNAIIWLNQKEKSFKKQYERLFEKQLFPKGSAAMKAVEGVYYACCDGASHATVFSLAHKSGDKRSSGKKIRDLYDINVDDIRSRRHLLFILHACRHILNIAQNVFKVGFPDKQDYEPIKVVCEMAQKQILDLIQKHKKQGFFRLSDIAKGTAGSRPR